MMTYIHDSSSQSELARLNYQAQLITKVTGLLPMAVENTHCTCVLDVGCGTGQWALDLACERQDAEVAGIDISPNMIDYALTRLRSYRLPNLSFETMDIFQEELPFAEGSFDFIHLRFGVGWVKGYAHWRLLLARLYVLLKPEGYLVVTEGEGIYTNSLALQRFHEILCTALYKAGYSLSPSPHFIGVVSQLGHLLHQAGFQQVDSEAFVLDYSAYNMEANMQWQKGFQLLLQESTPFLISTGADAEELARLDRQISIDMYRADFCGMGPLFSFSAQK